MFNQTLTLWINTLYLPEVLALQGVLHLRTDQMDVAPCPFRGAAKAQARQTASQGFVHGLKEG